MDDAAEHALVVKALTDGLGGCVEWDGGSAERVRRDPDLKGLTPEGIKRALIDFVRTGGDVQQIPETREWWCDNYRFYYKAILPMEDFPRGVFVEVRMTDDDDPDLPEVRLVNAHPQRS